MHDIAGRDGKLVMVDSTYFVLCEEARTGVVFPGLIGRDVNSINECFVGEHQAYPQA